MSGIKSILLILLSALALVVIWTLFSPQSKPPLVPDIATPAQPASEQTDNDLLSRIKLLEDELANEQNIRHQHEIRLTQLEQQLANTSTIDNLLSTVTRTEKNSPPKEQVRFKLPTLQDKLLAAHIPLDTIQRIQQRVGQNRLARLQLRDQAIREDWLDSPEYIEKTQQLPRATEGLREEFGEQLFDRYLYESGRPNRVLVREVFSGSAAQEAGIQAQDIILSYASELIFSMSELQQVTTEGVAGEPVLIELLRDGIPLSTSAPRGPLGISMTLTRKQPE